MSSIHKLKEALYPIDCIFKEDPIHNVVTIIFKNRDELNIKVDENSEIVIPEDVVKNLNIKEVDTLEQALWEFQATPPFMRNVDKWRKEKAKDIYYDNLQSLDEDIGAFERHWISEEQGLLEELFQQ